MRRSADMAYARAVIARFDVRGAPGSDPEATRASLEERGATFLWAGQQGPHRWITMTDPEGNEFCVS